MKPIYALHKAAAGEILDAGAFEYSHKLRDWLGSLDVRAGDRIEFGEKAARDDAEDAPISIVPEMPEPPKPLAVGDDQPF